MRTIERTAGGGVTGAGFPAAPRDSAPRFRLPDGRAISRSIQPSSAISTGGKSESRRLASTLSSRCTASARSPGHRDGEFGGLVLDGVEPVGIRSRLGQQPVARAQSPIERVDPAGVFGIDRKREAIEKAPPLRRRADEQGVHRRHQPNHAEMIGEGGGRGDRLAIDPAFAQDGRVVVRQRCAQFRCRAWPARARPRLRRRSPRIRRPRGTRLLRASRGANRGRARERKWLRSDLSCRRRSARRARSAGIGFERRCAIVAEIAERQAVDTSHSRQASISKRVRIEVRIPDCGTMP